MLKILGKFLSHVLYLIRKNCMCENVLVYLMKLIKFALNKYHMDDSYFAELKT